MYFHSYVFFAFLVCFGRQLFFFMDNLGFLEITEWEPCYAVGRRTIVINPSNSPSKATAGLGHGIYRNLHTLIGGQ